MGIYYQEFWFGPKKQIPCEINWDVDSPATSSLDRVSIPTPNQQNTTNMEGEFAEGVDDYIVRDQDVAPAACFEETRGPDSSEWLRTQIVVCGKVVGVSIDNNNRDWEHSIEFAQDWEEHKYATRTEGR
ncbi:hypothetical protein MRB53_020021 [Persea americana]|uniref:Uncharacterized protein n=1 Tax=Persea americana TaxID=3435 RepID=A0ACC2L0Z0_PERAE|nr:hypothetical protein MRB53_020021 [Persea americana]